MDKRTIFSKTGKGSLEISKKTIKLAADERQTLILIDGKSNFGELEEKLSRINPVRLNAVIARLVELDLVREFVTKQGPDSLMPSLGGPTAMKVEEISESDLDFTALAPVATDDVSREIKERRGAAEQAETAARAAREREAAEAEARRAGEEEARRKADEEAQRRADEEARVRAEQDRRRADEEAQRRAEDDRRRAEEDARRKADEEARRKAEDDARRKAEEEARRKAEEEARIRAEQERRRAEEEAQRRAEEERRRAEEDERRRVEEEARRKAEEEARRRAEEETRIRAELERQRAEEEAKRRAEEEARRRAEEERRRAEEERQRAEEEARRRAEEEARRRAEEEERQRDEALRREMEQAEQRRREETERRDREEVERRERVRMEEEARQAAYEREKRERDEAERRERGRREEDAKRSAIVEERRLREEGENREREEAARREAEHTDNSAQGAFAALPLDSSSAEADRQAAEEAARYTAALTPHLEEASAQSLDLDFNVAPAGGPSSILDPGLGASSILESADAPASTPSAKLAEREARRQLEREAKESAKAAAKAKKEAEREAARQAKVKTSRVRVRRGSGGSGGSSFSVGKLSIFIFVLLLIGGGIGYLYFMPVDKALIEGIATARFGMPVRVGSASFKPFPPQLIMNNVMIDDIPLPRVVGVPDPGSLAADKKIWNSLDVTNARLTLAQAKKLINVGMQEAPKGVSMTVQRVRLTGLVITDSPVALPVMDMTALLGPDGIVRQANVVFADNKGQVQLVTDDKGWLVDFESRGYAWGLGPKTAWESVRAKGLASATGIKFDSIAIAQFGGNINGAGELAWSRNWHFSGNMEVGGMDIAVVSQAFYNAAPVTGNFDGKFKVEMSAPALTRLVESTQLEGSVVVNKATVVSIDLARSAPAGALVSGTTRFSDFVSDVGTNGSRVMIKRIRANSGLLNVSGDVNVEADKTLSGTLNIELGIASNLTKAALKVTGTPAEPKLSK